MSHTLYSNPDHTVFYYIPDDVELPGGALVLQSLTGKRREVDPQAALAYEVPEERAQEITREIVAGFSRGIGRFLAGTLDMMRTAQREPDSSQKPRTTNVAEALGLSEEQLANDPDAVIQGIREAGKGLQQTLRQSWSADKVSEEVARERLEALAKLAREEVAPALADAVRNMPDALRDLMEDRDLEQDVRDATEKLESIGDKIRALREDSEE